MPQLDEMLDDRHLVALGGGQRVDAHDATSSTEAANVTSGARTDWVCSMSLVCDRERGQTVFEASRRRGSFRRRIRQELIEPRSAPPHPSGFQLSGPCHPERASAPNTCCGTGRVTARWPPRWSGGHLVTTHL